MMLGGQGIALGLRGNKSNAVSLGAGSGYNIPPNNYMVTPGPYSSLQYLDPVTKVWRTIGASSSLAPYLADSDGGNYRLKNLSGCVIGALITNAGSGLTNGIGTVTIAASAGGSAWTSVVGGAINATVAITTAGTLYTYPPILVIDAPPVGGIQATAHCTVTGGAIASVVVDDQGAGYTAAPKITVINDPRDTTGSGGVLTVNATLAGSGTLTAMYPTDNGTALTAVPTFTFSPASTIAATAVMNFVATGITVGVGGAVYGNAQPFLVCVPPAIVSGASVLVNPRTHTGLTMPRASWIAGTSTVGGAVTATGAVVTDAGFGHQAVPNGFVIIGGSGGPVTTSAQVTVTVGGITDVSYLQPV